MLWPMVERIDKACEATGCLYSEPLKLRTGTSIISEQGEDKNIVQPSPSHKKKTPEGPTNMP